MPRSAMQIALRAFVCWGWATGKLVAHLFSLEIRKSYKVSEISVGMIKRAEKEDLPTCSKVICQVIDEMESKYYSPEIIRLWKIHNSPSKLEEEVINTKFIFYEENKMVIGVGAIDGSHIEKIYVLPSHQRKGIGKMLVENLEQQARDQGASECDLNSTINSVGFYKKLGYQERGISIMCEGGINVTFTIMKKKL